MADLLAYALTSVADVKESLGIASSDHSKDNLITRKINQATELIENYCDRRFALTDYVEEEYNSSNIDELVLKQRPIVTDGKTFTLKWRNTPLNETGSETVESNLYFINESAGVLNLNFNALGSWNRYLITYSAGYATIPSDLAEAACLLVCYLVNNPSGSNGNLQQVREGQRERRFFATTGFHNIIQTLGIDETLDAYANMPVLTDR
jgi:hypothetical protein